MPWRALSRDQRSLRCVSGKTTIFDAAGGIAGKLRNTLGYSIHVARRKIVEVAKQWMQDANRALSLASEHLARLRKRVRQRTHNLQLPDADERAKRLNNGSEVIETKRRVTCHQHQVLRCCHVTLFG